jgi:hypothetical protein
MMMPRPIILLLGLLVAACAREYETFQPPPLDFSDRAPIRFEVEQVNVRSAFQPQGAPPFVGHTLALTPEAALRQLLEQRLQAVGGTGSVQAVIIDASITEEPIETTPGLRGYLMQEASARLKGLLKVRVDRLDEAGRVISSVSTEVTRSSSIPEDATYVQRQKIGHELVRDLVNDLDAGMATNLRDTFGSIIQS